MTSYLDLDDFVETAAELLALPEETVVKMARLDLAESALHAPQAGWGEVEVARWIAERLRPRPLNG